MFGPRSMFNCISYCHRALLYILHAFYSTACELTFFFFVFFLFQPHAFLHVLSIGTEQSQIKAVTSHSKLCISFKDVHKVYFFLVYAHKIDTKSKHVADINTSSIGDVV
jgi:hypothetical protein